MKKNRIKDVTDNIRMPEDVKMRIKAAAVADSANPKVAGGFTGMKISARVAVAAAVVAALSVSAFAMTEMMGFSFAREEDTVIIGATLSDDVKDSVSTKPLRAWNSEDGEISVKLSFGYMPEDMSERDNTPAKWNGTADYNRCITFVGFDLRRCDLETVIDGVDKADHFNAGANEAYLLTSDCEIAVYNKTLYVLFADEQFVVKAHVGEGITEDEIKSIAAGMAIEETDDVEHALPISNELAGSSDDSDNKVFYSDPIIVNKSDLLSIGEKGEYTGVLEGITITPLEYEIVDNVAGLDENCFHDFEWVKQFIDESGNFVPYKRTGVDREKGKFTATEDMVKKMVLVTVQFNSDTELDEHDIRAHLNTFNLKPLEFNDDGTVRLDVGGDCVIDRTPGRKADSVESRYIKSLGNGNWVVGYMLDEDECQGGFFYENTTAEIYYSFEK